MSKDYLSKIVEDFNKFTELLNGEKSHNSFSKRKDAIEALKLQSIPTVKHEEWKYTPLGFLNKIDTTFACIESDIKVSKEDIKKFILDDLNQILLVFVDGFFRGDLSTLPANKKDGVFIGSLRQAIIDNHIEIDKLGNSFQELNEVFVNLNTAYFRDGAFIFIPDNTKSEKFVHLMFISTSDSQAGFSNFRNLIVVGKNSSLKFIETSHLLGQSERIINTVTEVFCDDDSIIDSYRFHNESAELYSINYTNVVAKKSSVFNNNSLTLRSKFQRNNMSINLMDEHSEANLMGMYFLEGKDYVDNHTLVNHIAPNCRSDEIYKGIIDEKATAVFNGKIFVRPNAQKTLAYQSNKNILLSNDATIYTKPQLEIFADDVKCSHGATSGSIDENALFYLKTRGISETKATALLLNSFIADIVQKITIPELRDNIFEIIGKKLKIDDIFVCSSLDSLT